VTGGESKGGAGRTRGATADETRRRYEQRLLFADTIETIAALMRSQGVSQRELARRVGRSEGWISRVLNGRNNTTLKTVADLAWALGVRLSVIATEFDDRDRSPAAADPSPTWLERHRSHKVSQSAAPPPRRSQV
jgi:transcriptional regulator with XRE-family HTH domain